MIAHADILDEQESMRGPLLRALALHFGIAGLVFAWGLLKLGSSVEKWGDPNSLGGGAVGITPVASIPLPSRDGLRNPVANDTESQVPAPPKTQPKKAPVQDPNAIALKSKNAARKPARTPASQQKYSPLTEQKPSQVYARQGQALASDMYSMAPGGGGVGSGTGSPFGNRFGWYEQLLREKVARNWQSQELDSRLRQRVAVSFDILRNGTIQNVRVTQSSGNFALDQSAQRAIMMSNPVQPLPREYERDIARVEFWFGLQQ